MDAAAYSRLAEIITQAMQLPEEERMGAIEVACGGDDDLLQDALNILEFIQVPEESESRGGPAGKAHDPRPRSAFTESEIAGRRELLDRVLDLSSASPAAWMPERIGSYEIVRLVGKGGSGVVFEARQERPSRSVAVKLIHPTLVSEETASRFSREAEVLGRLQHPGIAQIFEAGSFDAGLGSQPFLAMELIDGTDLIAYVHEHQLDRRARLELFQRVVDAAAHAHERGIVHRDLKPDNVLVQRIDGQPKLVDFGIAAVADGDVLGRATLEGQLLGTVAYMAPEQADPALGPVGPSTDVYALCAMAFELICDRRLRRVEGLPVTQALSEIAKQDAPQIRRVVRGVDRDLAIVLQKGLELRPRDRYPSALELGADLWRYLEHRPIAAKPASRLDELTKFTRRNRAIVAGTAATAAALLIGLVATGVQARRATQATRVAERQLYGAEMLLATSAVLGRAQGANFSEVVDRWRPAADGQNRGVSPGWEWSLLDSIARDDTVRLGADLGPHGIAWHPDGETMAVVGGTAITIYETHTWEPVHELNLWPTPGWTGEFSMLLIHGAWDRLRPNRLYVSGVGLIAAWDVGESRPVWTREVAHAPSVRPMGDGRLYTVAEDASGSFAFQVLDAETGKLVETIEEDVQAMLELDASGEDLLLFGAGRGPGVFDSESRKMRWPFQGLKYTPVPTRMRWSPDGTGILVGSFTHSVRAYALDPPELTVEVLEHQQAVLGVSWHPDGTKFATACQDQTVRVFDAQSGQRLRLFLGHGTQARDVSYSPDGRRLASVATNEEVRIWNADEVDAISTLVVPGVSGFQEGSSLYWSETQERIVLTSRWSTVSVDPVSKQVSSLASVGLFGTPSSDGRWLASYTHKDGVRVVPAQWSGSSETHDGELGDTPRKDRADSWGRAVRFEGTDDPFMHLAWGPGDSEITAVSQGGVFRIERGPTGDLQAMKLRPISSQVADLELSFGGDRLAVASNSREVYCLALATGRTLCEFTLPGTTTALGVSWSPGADRVAVACSDGALRTVRVGDGEVEQVLTGHGDEVSAVAWHPTQDRIATGSRDNTVKLWDSLRGDLMASFVCEGIVSDVCWALEGRMLVVVDRGGKIYCFDASRSLLRR